MLNVMVAINAELIDTICIHNTGYTEGTRHVYEVVNINTGEKIIPRILHNRKKGYRPLLINVLKELDKLKIDEIIPERKRFNEPNSVGC